MLDVKFVLVPLLNPVDTAPIPETSPPAAAVSSAALSGMVDEPICNPAVPSETTVPDIVTAEPPGASDVPSMAKPVAAAAKVVPPTVNSSLGAVGNGMMVLPIWSAPLPRDTTVPEIVIGEPPGESVVPSMEMGTPEGAAVKVWPPTV